MTNRPSTLAACFNVKDNFRAIHHSPASRNAPLDGIRALSILAVIYFHAAVYLLSSNDTAALAFIHNTPAYLQWLLMGDRGVDSFFTLSGFLIGSMLIREQQQHQRINLKRFFIRRWLRLTPAYYFIIALLAIIALTQTNSHIDVRYLLANVFYIDNFFPMDKRYIGYGWSLAVEEQFYILFALLMSWIAIKRIQAMPLFIGLFIASFLIRYLILAKNPHLLITNDFMIATDPKLHLEVYFQQMYDNLYTRFGALMCGIILAQLYVNHARILEKLYNPVIGSAVLFFSLLLIYGSTMLPVYNHQDVNETLLFVYHVTHRNVFAIGITGLIAVSLYPSGLAILAKQFLGLKIWFPIAQLTYSIYLLHAPIVAGIYFQGSHLGYFQSISFTTMLIIALLALPPTLLFATMMFVFIEKPFMNMRDIKRVKTQETGLPATSPEQS